MWHINQLGGVWIYNPLDQCHQVVGRDYVHIVSICPGSFVVDHPSQWLIVPKAHGPWVDQSYPLKATTVPLSIYIYMVLRSHFHVDEDWEKKIFSNGIIIFHLPLLNAIDPKLLTIIIWLQPPCLLLTTKSFPINSLIKIRILHILTAWPKSNRSKPLFLDQDGNSSTWSGVYSSSRRSKSLHPSTSLRLLKLGEDLSSLTRLAALRVRPELVLLNQIGTSNSLTKLVSMFEALQTKLARSSIRHTENDSWTFHFAWLSSLSSTYIPGTPPRAFMPFLTLLKCTCISYFEILMQTTSFLFPNELVHVISFFSNY